MTSPWPKQVVLCDVSPRDGLQNECKLVSTPQKITLVQGLMNAGLPRIEVTGLGVAELRGMRQLEQENHKLRQLVADLSLDKVMLQPNLFLLMHRSVRVDPHAETWL